MREVEPLLGRGISTFLVLLEEDHLLRVIMKTKRGIECKIAHDDEWTQEHWDVCKVDRRGSTQAGTTNL